MKIIVSLPSASTSSSRCVVSFGKYVTIEMIIQTVEDFRRARYVAGSNTRMYRVYIVHATARCEEKIRSISEGYCTYEPVLRLSILETCFYIM